MLADINGPALSDLLRDGKTCRPCNSLLVDENSFAIIFAGNDPFQYRRNHEHLVETANTGCILCSLLLDRHQRLGPSLIDEVKCTSACPWSNVDCRREVLFLVEKTPCESLGDSKLRYLRFRGQREDHSQGSHDWELVLEAVAEHENPAVLLVPTRPPETNVASERSFETAQFWINECLHNHEACQKNPSRLFPTRVLDISNFESGLIKLHNSTPGEQADYIALSYCWGGPQPERTCKARLVSYLQGIQLQSQPQSIQDAVLVTKKLGVRYLWIDALCIVQDDPNDKAREIAQMARIYQNALLTISAASACSSVEGFLAVRRPWCYTISPFGDANSKLYQKLSLEIRCPNNVIGKIVLSESRSFWDLGDKISERAWTLQEAALSNRMLIYTHSQMLWRCRSRFENTGGHLTWWHLYYNICPILTLSATVPVFKQKYAKTGESSMVVNIFGANVYRMPISMLPDRTFQPRPASLPEPCEALSLSNVGFEWMAFVEIYSNRLLTNWTDKLPAIGGLAQRFQDETGWEYCAGLWRHRILVFLSWRRKLNAYSIRLKDVCAPSWSWASIRGAISYRQGNHYWASMSPQAIVHEVDIKHSQGQAPFGKVLQGEIKVEAWLRRIDIEIKSGPYSINDPKNRLYFDDVFLVDPTCRMRLASGILDESIKSYPYRWDAPVGGGGLFALVMFASPGRGDSPRWSVGNRHLRTHGLLVLRLDLGVYCRIGWYDSFACNPWEYLMTWVGQARKQTIQLI
ncbi:HET-domain-containing protein [Lepidopterella palustris CBS 459.81]|uniref:HET-domain-containing protein n=1 Tax=Lepidopterella palustris CBS 459.81 TaxID=1314670 RepID=A0A8E2E2Y2_9PEZI|nr:HET-domain-containing protein [Lepidopterella palustris CBS 459.81]